MIDYIINLIILMSINSILALTLNFIMGYAGIFSLAHAVFFGFGAYTGAFISINYTASLFVTIPAAMLICAVISIILALPALRVRGEYFVAASLGLQVIGVTIFSEWKGFTGGIGGVLGIPSAELFGYEFSGSVSFMILSVTSLLIICLIIAVLARTSFGRSLKAIRDSESAALSLGKNIAVIKTLSVMLSAMLASVAGVLYANYIGFVNVETFTLEDSVLLMAMVIIGGTGTILGPIVGAIVLMALPSLFSYMWFLPESEIGSIQQIAYGTAMVLLMLFRPGGIVNSGKKG